MSIPVSGENSPSESVIKFQTRVPLLNSVVNNLISRFKQIKAKRQNSENNFADPHKIRRIEKKSVQKTLSKLLIFTVSENIRRKFLSGNLEQS